MYVELPFISVGVTLGLKFVTKPKGKKRYRDVASLLSVKL